MNILKNINLLVSGKKITCCCCGANQKVEYFKTPKIYKQIYSLEGKKFYWEGKCESCDEELIVIDNFSCAVSENLSKHYKYIKDYSTSTSTPFCNNKSHPLHLLSQKVIWKRLETKFSEIEDEISDEDLSDEEENYRFQLGKLDIASIQLRILKQKNISLVQLNDSTIDPMIQGFYYATNVWFPECYWKLSKDKNKIEGVFHCNLCLGEEHLISIPLEEKLSHETKYKRKNNSENKTIKCPVCKENFYYDFREDLLINENQFMYLYKFINSLEVGNTMPFELGGTLDVPTTYSDN